MEILVPFRGFQSKNTNIEIWVKGQYAKQLEQ